VQTSFAVAFAACLLVGACSSSSGPTAGPTAAPTSAAKAFEDLGLRSFSMPRPNLLAAGQPTKEQFAQLAKLGVHVICLRLPDEVDTGWEEQQAKELGAHFTRLPIDGQKGLTVDNAQKLAQAMAAADGGPTLVCCGSSNRVGAMLALKAFLIDKEPAADALALGKAAGLKALEPQVQEKLK
jgi:protein tyrosine phosphatase (PTP) superfamily phosphohydrolase (DUF442 family)